MVSLLRLGIVLLGCCSIAAGVAYAQDFPTKPLRIVVPLPPGGIGTTISRYVGDQLQERWKQPVVVDYRPGAGGFIAADHVSKADPDGYTLLLAWDANAIFRLLVKGNTFDPEKDLASVSLLVRAPYVLQSPGAIPPRSLKEFIAYAKANPGKLNVGTVQNSGGQLNTIRFLKATGIDAALIFYQGGAPNMAALLANDIQLYLGNYGPSVPHFQSGKLVPLAVTSANRFFLAPDVPSMKENGLDLDMGFWFGLAVPPRTSPAIINRISSAAGEIMKSPGGREAMSKIGLEAVGSSAEEMARYVAEDAAAKREAARAGGITPQ
jgi:tripartite-type tricarboxylate transporter receptor subunit TctC